MSRLTQLEKLLLEKSISYTIAHKEHEVFLQFHIEGEGLTTAFQLKISRQDPDKSLDNLKMLKKLVNKLT